MENRTKLRAVVIGCGRISPMHLIPLTELPETELVAVCDTDRGLAEKTGKDFGGRAYLDYREMIEKEKPDAVHICLPHYLHTPVALYALEKGCNVLTEKPMSIGYAEAEKCVAEAESRGLKYGVIFQCRYNGSVRWVKRVLTEGKLGKIISARSVLTWRRENRYYLESDWKGTWAKEGGGVVIDQAIHSIDLVNRLIGDSPISVSCSMSNRGHPGVEVEDSAEGLITYKNGVRYGFYCMNNYGCDEPIELKLLCEKGKVTMSYDVARIEYADGRTETASPDPAPTDYHGRAKQYWGIKHFDQIRDFYRSIIENRRFAIDGREALGTQRLVCAIYESAKTGKTVTIG